MKRAFGESQQYWEGKRRDPDPHLKDNIRDKCKDTTHGVLFSGEAYCTGIRHVPEKSRHQNDYDRISSSNCNKVYFIGLNLLTKRIEF